MKEGRICLLENDECFRIFCRLFDADMGCMGAFGEEHNCMSCPSFHMRNSQILIAEKGVSIEEAYKRSMTKSVPHHIGKKIVRDAIFADKKPYPEWSGDEILKRFGGK